MSRFDRRRYNRPRSSSSKFVHSRLHTYILTTPSDRKYCYVYGARRVLVAQDALARPLRNLYSNFDLLITIRTKFRFWNARKDRSRQVVPDELNYSDTVSLIQPRTDRSKLPRTTTPRPGTEDQSPQCLKYLCNVIHTCRYLPEAVPPLARSRKLQAFS